jgi:hypothetical protein
MDAWDSSCRLDSLQLGGVAVAQSWHVTVEPMSTLQYWDWMVSNSVRRVSRDLRVNNRNIVMLQSLSSSRGLVASR